MVDYDELDDGVRELVKWLNRKGFETTDSGDGSKVGDMEGAVSYPLIAIRAVKGSILEVADKLHRELLRAGVAMDGIEKNIEASYSPIDRTCVVLLIGVTSSDIGK